MRWSRLIPAAVLGAFLFSSLALAANPKSAALVKEGDRLYKDNKYREAAEALQKAYELEPQPVLLYNIARAFDQAGELKLALDNYRQFVGQEGADAQLVKKANLAMDRLRTLVAKEEAGKQVQDADKKRLEDEAAAAKEKARSEEEKARLQKEAYEAKEKAAAEAAKSKTSTRLVASIVVGAVAVAGLGTGIAFGVLSSGSKSSFKSAASVASKQKFASDTRTQALIADVSFGVALAAAVTAVILFPKGGSHEPEKSVQVVIGPTSNGAFAGIGGSF
jgi:tetratricopeptide (TPR) repeat protein